MILSPEVYRHLIRHVRESLPGEAVGLLAGRSTGHVDLILPLTNIANCNQAFLADPFAQFSALRRISEAGLDLLAIYHSHPGGGVELSPQDLKYAQEWPCAHLVVAVSGDPSVPERLQAFRCLPSGLLARVNLVTNPG